MSNLPYKIIDNDKIAIDKNRIDIFALKKCMAAMIEHQDRPVVAARLFERYPLEAEVAIAIAKRNGIDIYLLELLAQGLSPTLKQLFAQAFAEAYEPGISDYVLVIVEGAIDRLSNKLTESFDFDQCTHRIMQAVIACINSRQFKDTLSNQ